MADLDVAALITVSERLDRLGLRYAFTGGSVVNLLLDNPDFSPARETKDVDVIVELLVGRRYSEIEEQLRSVEFKHDMSEGAPKCRWLLGAFKVDVMPTESDTTGLNTRWFPEVLERSRAVPYKDHSFKLVSPVGLLVTKYLTFQERGKGDFMGSHDMEDFITVIDGRENIVAEVGQSPVDFRRYLLAAVRSLLKDGDFQDALPGYLQPDPGSQARLPLLRKKLEGIASLPDRED